MRYEDRWYDRDRDEGRDRSRHEDYGQADVSNDRRGDARPWEERRFDRDRDHERDHERDAHRAWRPFGETGPTRYGGGDDTAGYDRSNRYDLDRGGDYRRDYGEFGRRYGYARDFGRGRDAGFGETGGRHAESYGHERYGERDQWGSNPRSGAGNDARNWFDKASDKVQAFFGDESAERRSRWDEVRAGEHRGRGPKGYRRSDERIRDDVSDRLADDSWLDASDIEVRVDNCEVTLTGFVASRDDKRRAERLAEDVSGVDNVQNSLRVRREGDGTPLYGDGSTTTDTSLSGTKGVGRA